MRESGIDVIGKIGWGTHICHLYHDKKELVDVLIPYFKAGLLNNEMCLWATCHPLETREALEALGRTGLNVSDYVEKGQLQCAGSDQIYKPTGRFDVTSVLRRVLEEEKRSKEQGYDGMRVAGCAEWIREDEWEQFSRYESQVDKAISTLQMTAICSYPINGSELPKVLQVVSNHDIALLTKNDHWLTIQSARKRLSELESVRLLEELNRRLMKVCGSAIPICTECKKVRTDDQSWEKLETCISAHPDANFSHGLCRECIRKIYPEDADRIIEQMDATDG